MFLTSENQNVQKTKLFRASLSKDMVKNKFPEFELEISYKILDNNRT